MSSAWGPKVFAQPVATTAGSRNLLSGVALNAAAGTRTVTIACKGYSKVRVTGQFTYAAATDFRITPTVSLDDGVTYNAVKSRSIASGTSTVSTFVDVITSGSANQTFDLSYDTAGADFLKLVFSGTAAGASDLVSCQAVRTGVGG